MTTDSPTLHVCCGGIKMWSKVVAWIQIIFSALASIILFIVFFILSRKGEKRIQKIIETSHTQLLIPYRNLTLGLILIMSILAVFAGSLLLKGMNKKNAKYLIPWLVYTIVCLVTNVVGELVTLDTKSFVVGSVLRILLSLAVTTFSISILIIYKRQGGDHHHDQEKVKVVERTVTFNV